MRRRRLFHDLPLFWKVLVPFLTLMVIVGASGVFLVVRDLSSRAQASLDQDLTRRSVDAEAFLRERELYLLESANFAANVEGMSRAVAARDTATVGRLLQSALALKADLTFVAAADASGVGLVEFTRLADAAPSFSTGTPWSGTAFAQALQSRDGTKSSGWMRVGDATMLGIAAPICPPSDGCTPVGLAIVAIAVDRLASAATGESSRKAPRASSNEASVAIFDLEDRRLTSAGSVASRPTPGANAGDEPVRRLTTVGSTEIATRYVPFTVQGGRIGTLAVSIPTEPVFSSVRGAGTRLALIVLVAMVGIVGLGALLSRSILRQVRTLVDTNRALGRGDLSARAAVLGYDELGELAEGVNQMADQLQASYETLELRVEERTEEVRRLLRDRTEFFAGMSHELRTPLAIILTQLEMLTEATHDPALHNEAVETIRASATELLGLVNDILDLARTEAGPADVQLEAVELQDVFEELHAMLVRLGAAADVAVVVAVPASLPAVTADRDRLRVAIVNLVDNAIKYTPAGGDIRVSAIVEGGEVTVSVADTGVGIPPEVGDRVFEPFYRVRGTRPQHGQSSSGLGLALTRRWIEAQGGTISWSANPDGGTVFTFALALAPAPSPPRRRARTPRRSRQSQVTAGLGGRAAGSSSSGR